MAEILSEQEIQRRQKLSELIALGINPYPAEEFLVTANALAIKTNANDAFQNQTTVSCAGRLMSVRDMGKACFAVIQDHSGRIQLYIRKDDFAIGNDFACYESVWKKLIDIGDIIGIKGFVFTTKTGEISVHVKELILLSKALKPLPIVKTDSDGISFDEVTDPEFRYRQRYVDLIINPKVKKTFEQRSKIINSIRAFLNNNGALEVDTPVLQSIPGGAAAKPFLTHHNALDIPLYLRIANELYLKRLIIGGFDWVYEFSRNFRNEGMDRTHNPEFTVLEFYVAYRDYFWMMKTTETLLEKIAFDLHGTTQVIVGSTTINFAAPYPRITIFEAIKINTQIDVSQMNEAELIPVCKQFNISVDPSMGKAKLIDAIFSDKCEGTFIQPTFIIDYPIEMSPLTKKHRQNEGLVERFELMINGKEIANAYSELNDPIEQRERFEDQLKLIERGDDEAMFIDNDFLRALEYGMPPTSGIGIGIDRLCMLLTNQHSIQDVLLFPTMRPENFNKKTPVIN